MFSNIDYFLGEMDHLVMKPISLPEVLRFTDYSATQLARNTLEIDLILTFRGEK